MSALGVLPQEHNFASNVLFHPNQKLVSICIYYFNLDDNMDEAFWYSEVDYVAIAHSI